MKTVQERQKLLCDIEIAEGNVDDLKREYLTAGGWEYKCDLPVAYWMWQKEIGGRLCVFRTEDAIQQQQAWDDANEIEAIDPSPAEGGRDDHGGIGVPVRIPSGEHLPLRVPGDNAKGLPSSSGSGELPGDTRGGPTPTTLTRDCDCEGEEHEKDCKEHPDYDPTPWCSACGARKQEDCDCPPWAEND